MATSYEAYQELARIRTATRASAAIQAVQAAVLNDMNLALDSIHGEMAEVRQLHREGLAAQQAMLQREALQDRLEEFIYQSEKLTAEFQSEQSNLPPSSRYFTLLGVLERIKYENISTPFIRGRDNKAAFDRVVGNIRSLAEQLKNDAEVQEAIAWAKQEQKRRREEMQKQIEIGKKKSQAELNRLNQELRQVESQPIQHVAGFLEWLAAVAINIPRNPKSIALLTVPFLLLFLWRVFFHPNPPPFQSWLGAVFSFYGAILLPLYSIVGYRTERGAADAQNAQRIENIERLKREMEIARQQSSTPQAMEKPSTGIAVKKGSIS